MPENPRVSISVAISSARARLPGTAARDTAGIGIGRSSWVIGRSDSECGTFAARADHALRIAVTRLPERGRSRDDVLGELDAMRTRDVDWR